MNLILRAKRRLKKEFNKIFNPPYGEILALHCVVEKRSQLKENRAMEITPTFLEQTILNYKAAGYRLVSLDEVQQQVEKRKRSRRKFVCFTLDDGYADNLKYAYPVFQKHNCPFAIYVTTDYPDRKAQFWWNQLEVVLIKYEKLTINSVEYDCSDLKKKNQTFKQIREKVYSEAQITQTALQQLFKENDCDASDLALSWEQIVELASNPLCTIAAHSVTHASLPALSDEMIRKELSEGKKKIEEKIKKPVKHFSYPYGNCDSRVVDLVKEQYSTAVLNRGGFVQKNDNLYTLNRRILFDN